MMYTQKRKDKRLCWENSEWRMMNQKVENL
jgi:hypothetical protein